MRCALLQINPTVGDIEGNRDAILAAAREAAQRGADVCVTPELALIGYPPRDLLLFPAVVRRIEEAEHHLARELARESAGGPALILGTVGRNLSGSGRPLYNQAAFLAQGAVRARYNKHAPRACGGFDESRHFEPGHESVTLPWRGKRLALTVGADILDGSVFSSPGHGNERAFDTLINLAAFPFAPGTSNRREIMLAAAAARYRADVLHVNQIGGNDELVFAGGSLRIAPSGRLTHRAAAFAEDLLLVDTGSAPGAFAPESHASEAGEPGGGNPEIWQALVLGTRDYARKTGMSRAVLGLSGGVDSALVAAVACAALGPKNVTGILMPSPWSSDHGLADARELARNLGMPIHEIPIEAGMRAFADMLAPVFAGAASRAEANPPGTPDTTAENIQARIRGMLLMAFSNTYNALLLTTGNKSELAVGYCTLYGDMCGGLAVIADLFKTQVYSLCRWLNAAQGRLIPERILTKAPSAELRPNQTDQDSLPPYDQLDAMLRLMLEERRPAASLRAAGHDAGIIRHVAGLIARSEFKRRQAAPGIAISGHAFGPDRHMPIACSPPYPTTDTFLLTPPQPEPKVISL